MVTKHNRRILGCVKIITVLEIQANTHSKIGSMHQIEGKYHSLLLPPFLHYYVGKKLKL